MNIGIAAFVGFLINEVLTIRKAVLKNDSTPENFSWGYYFSKPLNVLNIALNALATVGFTIGHSEIIILERWAIAKIPGVENVPAEGYPILTGLLIGLLAAWLLKWVLGKAKKIAPEADPSDA